MNKLLVSGVAAAILCLLVSGAPAAESPHGLAPAGDMPFIPELGGLRHKAFKNQYGQRRDLSEAVLVRKSSVKAGKATVPAGGLCYISETEQDAVPFRRDLYIVCRYERIVYKSAYYFSVIHRVILSHPAVLLQAVGECLTTNKEISYNQNRRVNAIT